MTSNASRADALVRALHASVEGDRDTVAKLFADDVQAWTPALSAASLPELLEEFQRREEVEQQQLVCDDVAEWFQRPDGRRPGVGFAERTPTAELAERVPDPVRRGADRFGFAREQHVRCADRRLQHVAAGTRGLRLL